MWNKCIQSRPKADEGDYWVYWQEGNNKPFKMARYPDVRFLEAEGKKFNWTRAEERGGYWIYDNLMGVWIWDPTQTAKAVAEVKLKKTIEARIGMPYAFMCQQCRGWGMLEGVFCYFCEGTGIDPSKLDELEHDFLDRAPNYQARAVYHRWLKIQEKMFLHAWKSDDEHQGEVEAISSPERAKYKDYGAQLGREYIERMKKRSDTFREDEKMIWDERVTLREKKEKQLREWLEAERESKEEEEEE